MIAGEAEIVDKHIAIERLTQLGAERTAAATAGQAA